MLLFSAGLSCVDIRNHPNETKMSAAAITLANILIAYPPLLTLVRLMRRVFTWLLPLILLAGFVAPLTWAEDTVCARVKIEIRQELTLERQAFDAEMKINNTTDTGVIENVSVAVKVTDENGTPVAVTDNPNDLSAKFFLRLSSKQNIDAVDGTGTVSPKTTSTIDWLLINFTLTGSYVDDAPAQNTLLINLRGKTLGITPLFLSSTTRIKGLVRLLGIALRVLCLVEFAARKALQEEGTKLDGIYAGNPKRATARPTTEMMLIAFRGLNLTVINVNEVDRCCMTALNAVQTRILGLIGFPPTIYQGIEMQSGKPAHKMGEP